MTIEQAVKQLIKSEEFNTTQKYNATLRNNLRRYRKGKLKTAAKIEMLLQFGYTVVINPPNITDVKKPKQLKSV